MSSLNITMATINFAFFFLTLSALLAAHHARHLNDGYIHVKFGQRPPLPAAPELIQMVTGEQEPQLSPPSYGRDNPKAPPSPKVAPSRGQATYGGGNPKTPPSPEYGGDNLNVAPPSLESAESRGQNGYGRDKTKAPPSPEKAPSHGQKTYGGGNRKTPPLPEVDGGNKADLNSPTRYGRVDPRTPPSPDPSDPRIQSVDGRVDPVEPTPPEPAEPTRPMLGGSLCVGGGSACSGLSTSAVGGRRNRSPPRAPALSSDAQIKAE